MKKILMTAILLLPMTLLYSFEVNIILNDGSVVKGNMLGKTAEELYLDGENGKARSIKIADIKSVFDAAKGSQVDLKAPQPTQPSTNVQNNQNSQVQQPQLIPVPGSEGYYDYNGELVYYYGGYWWRYEDGAWYRSPFYTGPWIIIEGPYVPGPVFYIGPHWGYFGPHRGFYHGWGWHGGWHGGWRGGWHR